MNLYQFETQFPKLSNRIRNEPQNSIKLTRSTNLDLNLDQFVSSRRYKGNQTERFDDAQVLCKNDLPNLSPPRRWTQIV